MDIVLIRHGRTFINEQGCYGGVTDTELSEAGKSEVSRLSKCIQEIEFDAVYASPLKRGRQTADILGKDYKVDQRLREMNFGIFEGLSYSEIIKMYPEESRKWQNDFINHRIRGGESLFDVFTRAKDFIEDMSRNYKKVLAVTHGGVIACSLSLVFGSLDYFYRFKINHGAASIISIDEDYMYIKGINCTEEIVRIL